MTRRSDPEIIDETTLPAFRAGRLSPEALFAHLQRHVQVLARIAIGVGKSSAVDRHLAWTPLHAFFDLVVYVAPTWSIIDERRIVLGLDASPVPWMVIKPRPDERCGPLSAQWRSLEARGCAAMARRDLCGRCPEQIGGAPCDWPSQFERVRKSRLVFCTEQQFLINPRFFDLLIWQCRAKRPLLIFDEAKLVNASFETTIDEAALRNFRTTLEAPEVVAKVSAPLASAIRDIVGAMLAADGRTIESLECTSPSAINFSAAHVQSEGVRLFGEDFTYLGHELDLFSRCPHGEKWKDADGTIRFTSRPLLSRHLLVLSAHMNAEHLAHRLRLGHIESPFGGVRFRHSSTRIINLRNRSGAESYFKKNSDQILGTIAVMILRNIALGRTTLLVSRKKLKAFCAEKLADRLRHWGVEARFVFDDFDGMPSVPDPLIIPIIHYGVLGTNDFEAYRSAYCLNSYYVSDRELNRAVNEAEPDRFKIGLVVRSFAEMLRRVELEYPDPSVVDLVGIAQRHLRHLEVDPVIQAVGRVRFATLPREVLLFGMHDFSEEFGQYEEAQSLVALRGLLAIPDARAVDAFFEVERLGASLDQGSTVAAAAAGLGMSRRTAFRRFKAYESAKNTHSIFLECFWHSVGCLARVGAGA